MQISSTREWAVDVVRQSVENELEDSKQSEVEVEECLPMALPVLLDEDDDDIRMVGACLPVALPVALPVDIFIAGGGEHDSFDDHDERPSRRHGPSKNHHESVFPVHWPGTIIISHACI